MWSYKTRGKVTNGPRSSFGFKTNGPVLTELGKMKQMVNTKKTLGRVWFRYFQLYGMKNKLTATCVNIRWTQMDRENFAKEHFHLVNQFAVNMVKNNEPDIPQPGDLEWLTSHPEVARTGNAPKTQMNMGQKKRRC